MHTLIVAYYVGNGHSLMCHHTGHISDTFISYRYTLIMSSLSTHVQGS